MTLGRERRTKTVLPLHRGVGGGSLLPANFFLPRSFFFELKQEGRSAAVPALITTMSRMLARGLWKDVDRQRAFMNEIGKGLGIKEVTNTNENTLIFQE